MFAVIDIETSGGRVSEERIIEVAVYRSDGLAITDQFISLVNPEGPIQPFVQNLTGITEKMVRRAPKFHEIARRLIEITEDAVFVAHNAGFDYRVVQEEFSRLGYDFQRRTLDTIHFAQKLIPGLSSYGLDPLCDALGIINTNRHRADGDARSTLKLLGILLDKDTGKEIEAIVRRKSDTSPDHDFAEITRNYHNTTGLFYIHNAEGKVIYLGKSNNLRNHVDQLLLATNERAIRIQEEAKSISVDPTGSELMARILEHIELRKLNPPLNKKSDGYELKWGLYIDRDNQARETAIRIQKVNRNVPDLYFDNENTGIDFAARYCKLYGIDPAKVALSFQHKRMMRACEKLQEPFGKNHVDPNRRIANLSFEKPDILVIDEGRSTGEKTAIMIENGSVTGFGHFDLEYQLGRLEALRPALTPLPSSNYINSLVLDAVRRKRVSEIRPIQKNE